MASKLVLVSLCALTASAAQAADTLILDDTFDDGPTGTGGVTVVSGLGSFDTTPTTGCESTWSVPTGRRREARGLPSSGSATWTRS